MIRSQSLDTFAIRYILKQKPTDFIIFKPVNKLERKLIPN